MRSSACRQILVAAMIGWMALAAVPLPAKSAQDNWIEQLTQRIREQSRLTTHPATASSYERCLVQLQRVQRALTQGDTRLVQREMGHLVAMVGAAESEIDDASAKLLLASIGALTPAEYLDSATRSQLRLIREIGIAGSETEEIQAPSTDAPYSLTTQTPHQTGSWGSWIFRWADIGKSNPLIALGAGVLFLVGVGVVVLALVALGVGTPRSEAPVQPKQTASQVDEKKT